MYIAYGDFLVTSYEDTFMRELVLEFLYQFVVLIMQKFNENP